MNNWKTLNSWLSDHEQNTGEQALLERNFVLAGYPELWRKDNWREALERFRQDLALFGLFKEQQS